MALTLEISVNDTVETFDELPGLERRVVGLIRDWHASEQTEPLMITLTKQDNKSPPTLGIHVSDLMDLTEALS